MSFLQMIAMLIIGILILIVGVITKKKWLMLISIVPFAFSLGNIIVLLLMWLDH
ncbi:hypothetical protein [Clostridium grantii]|uniref:hypothetical protein n=1 Tax=Clostridium grantii TaxID=40575 RepID=UPI0013562BF7|nr:hypothetical protein [Clostridium grantii]